MCNICIDLENGKLTREEAKNAAKEMVLTVDDEYSEEMGHYLDIYYDTLEEDEKESEKDKPETD